MFLTTGLQNVNTFSSLTFLDIEIESKLIFEYRIAELYVTPLCLKLKLTDYSEDFQQKMWYVHQESPALKRTDIDLKLFGGLIHDLMGNAAEQMQKDCLPAASMSM